MPKRVHVRYILATTGCLLCGQLILAQDLDPRRWSHLPADVNYAGAAYFYTQGDITFDPVLDLEDVEVEAQTFAVKYIRTFELLDRSARIELAAPYQDVRWDGLLQGEPAATARHGIADPQVRFAVNLVGAPPLRGSEFIEYLRAHPHATTVGAALTVSFPVGEYYEDKLLNLGENRYSFRAEMGVEHRRGKWLAECTATASLYTDNDEFWNGNQREQEPYVVGQGIVSYTFRPGLWAGAGVSYGIGGESAINGVDKDDEKENMISGLVVGLPINRSLGVKIGYFNHQARASTGTDSDTFSAAVAALW